MFWKIKTCFERAPWPLGLTKEWRSDRYFTPHSSISVCCRKKTSGEKSRRIHLPVVSWRAAVWVPWERKHGSALNTSSAVGVCVLRKKTTQTHSQVTLRAECWGLSPPFQQYGGLCHVLYASSYSWGKCYGTRAQQLTQKNI